MTNPVKRLRDRLNQTGVDAYIVPSFDSHQSEYVAPHFKKREWLTGFTGSAGTAIVTQDHAVLWTDGRYHTQAQRQLAGGPFSLIREGLPGEPTMEEWLRDLLPDHAVIGFDGSCLNQVTFAVIQERTKDKEFSFSIDTCLLDGLWDDRPPLPKEPVIDFPLAFAGASRLDKLDRVRSKMTEWNVDLYLIPNLDDIAWLMNIRGADIPFCPFVLSYLTIAHDQTTLFIHQEKLPKQLIADFKEQGIRLVPYESIYEALRKTDKRRILFDPQQVSAKLFSSVPEGCQMIPKGDLVTKMKAVKSEAELRNIHNAQVKDGVAMMHFLVWLTDQVPKGSITELDIGEQVAHFRSNQPNWLGPSFDPIAAYKENAAMMHYKATQENHAVIGSEGFLLIDSGGQYMDGTTDITRTVALGPVTKEEQVDYTLTLKAHIGLSQAIFLEGTCGPHIDVLARRHMWNRGLDYKCGTGHGIGYALGVHEGPHRIRNNDKAVPLEPGMLVTNEPGVYKPGRHGVRIENTVCVRLHQQTEFGRFYRFETISFCPIDTTPIVLDLLTDDEKDWLNAYHRTVYETLAPQLEGRVLERLQEWTKPV